MIVPATAAWHWTSHASLRCAEMGLPRSRVEAVLRQPDLDYPSECIGRRLACGNQLAVVYSTDDLAIITVLWNGLDGRPESMAA